MAERTTTTEGTVEEQARAWLAKDGWQLPPDEIRAELEKRGVAGDLRIELLDGRRPQTRRRGRAGARIQQWP